MTVHQYTISGITFNYVNENNLVSVFACMDGDNEWLVDDLDFPFEIDELSYIENHITTAIAFREMAKTARFH